MQQQIPDELTILNQYSVELGSNPNLVQGAGGNTSFKKNEIMWIKASGFWLMNAVVESIMVPIQLPQIREAFKNDKENVENSIQFVPQDLNPNNLRPSIESSMHAIMPQKYVIHVHCVETISCAVLSNCQSILKEKLAGLNYAFIPYFRPGLPLSSGIDERLKPDTNVLILGNHGLVVAGDDLEETKALLKRVCEKLSVKPRQTPKPNLTLLAEKIKNTQYEISEDDVHGVALDSTALKHAMSGSLYPDHVIFLGPGSVVANEDETAEEVRAKYHANFGSDPASIIFPNLGVVMLDKNNKGAVAMAKCLCDVTLRLPQDAKLNVLSDEDNAALLNWDAEKYRQALNAK